LEHLEDPVNVMQHAHNALRPGGGIVFTVPSYPWLYSDWDKGLGHFRRYTARAMRTQAANAGFKVQFITHWNGFSLPAALAVRGYEKLFPQDRKPAFPRVSPLMNRTLLKIAKLERGWIQAIHMPVGLSLVGVLRK
jgi:SAM-dependent methyltransferase